MAFTQAQLDALDAQIAAAGIVKTDSISDRSTTFIDIDEMKKLRQMMAAQLNSTGRTRYATHTKGA